ncbi:thioredoxin family protein [Dichotomicrobium thermohalophilum]|uniref:Thioredoxin-related protein n=1 Tax=Dichotomicrobium thermohalophilum TaxID=933063 RepID=A0A397Q3F6_9HYPH|nr:thioredoxin family protein [Dichotomicrobium thermohalophilum]RIA56060.1 thioredoxin-related protein [Dichotomicrobium thermohalophilum]
MLKRLLAVSLLLLMVSPAAAAELGPDGLHKTEWMRQTFNNLREDLAEARAEGKRFAIIFEQRGCIYCEKMHEEVFPDPKISEYIKENFFFVQYNLFGDLPVTDFDGTEGTEKQMARRWGIHFTPTIMFFPEDDPGEVPADEAAVVTMPGAFGKGTTYNMLTWIVEKGYESGETFQRYHARKLQEQQAAN